MLNQDHRRSVFDIAVFDVAQAMAPGWQRRRPFMEGAATPVREWLVGALAPQPGQTLLELAAGAGDTGFQAAGLVGRTGRLICTDISPAMLDVARVRGAELGVDNVDYRLIDAEHIELETDSVDGVLCRFGYMLTADPAAALTQTRRVLRPGGRVALAVWGPPHRNPFLAAVGPILVERGHLPPPAPTQPSPFAMSNEERTRGLLRKAGFTTVRTDEVPIMCTVTDVDEYLDITADTAGPIALVLRALTDSERSAVRVRLDDALARFATPAGFELPGLALTAVAW